MPSIRLKHANPKRPPTSPSRCLEPEDANAMNTDKELPSEVVAELDAGRKIAAIKKLRTMRGLELTEAKRLVDLHLQQHEGTSGPKPPQAETGIGRMLLLAIGVAVIFAIYKYFG